MIVRVGADGVPVFEVSETSEPGDAAPVTHATPTPVQSAPFQLFHVSLSDARGNPARVCRQGGGPGDVEAQGMWMQRLVSLENASSRHVPEGVALCVACCQLLHKRGQGLAAFKVIDGGKA